jgi:poly [ADP-ribose] polymerase 10/14/15
VGPRYKDGKSGEEEKLKSAVKAALEIAEKKKLKSIAMPAISSGIFGYPINESSKVIVDSVTDYFEAKKKEKSESTIEKVILCLFDEDTFNNFVKALENHGKKK